MKKDTEKKKKKKTNISRRRNDISVKKIIETSFKYNKMIKKNNNNICNRLTNLTNILRIYN